MGQRAGYDPPGHEPAPRSPVEAKALETEFSERFVDMMRNRMIISLPKYGPIAAGFPERVNAAESLERRLAEYRRTGNVEWLVDVANFALIEFMHPSHPEAHLRGTDSDESPGRSRRDGDDAHGPNFQTDSSVERLRGGYERSGD